jgi:hypothetical protein
VKYVKPSLHLLNLDEFDYPRLHVYVGMRDYGNLDRQEEVSVFFSKPFAGRMSDHYVYQSETYGVDVDEIRAEIKEFNSNLKENWDKVILGLLTKQESDLIDQIASRKNSLKIVRKTMKKFGKDS